MKDKSEPTDVGEIEMKDFCAAIGELILWASLIDGQFNKALVAMMALPEHAMMEPIIAQLDARPKAELLKKRAKLITSADWRNGVTNWVQRAEKVNGYRNTVAHHGIRIADGKITLHSDQLGKIMGSLKDNEGTLEAGDAMGAADIQKWIEAAKTAYTEGQIVIRNLEAFRVIALSELAKTRDGGE